MNELDASQRALISLRAPWPKGIDRCVLSLERNLHGHFETSVYGAGSGPGTKSRMTRCFGSEIHDSDIATIDYRSDEGASGRTIWASSRGTISDDPDAGGPRGPSGRFDSSSSGASREVSTCLPEELRGIHSL